MEKENERRVAYPTDLTDAQWDETKASPRNSNGANHNL